MRLRVAAALLAIALGAVYVALSYAVLGEVDLRLVGVTTGIAAIALVAAFVHIGRLTTERERAYLAQLLPDALRVPQAIDDTARTSLHLLLESGIAQAGLVAVAGDGEDEMVPIAAEGYPEGWSSQARPRPLPEGARAMLTRDAQRHPWARPLGGLLADRADRIWVLEAPLVSAGNTLGVLLLAGSSRGHLGDLALMEGVAGQLASALDHAALYEASYERERGLEEQEIRRNEFMAAISHEIRTPLTSIQAFTELLQLDAESMNETAEQLVTSLSHGVERLSALVNDLLDLARAEQSQLRPERHPLDVRETLRAAESVLRPAFMLREQGITMELPEDALICLADARSLEQVVLNLLSNANRHTPPRGAVIVRATRGTGGGARIEVEDSGPGIDTEDRERVFEPYYRVRRPGASAVPGSGLGLAIARRLTELQGGRIWVEAAPSGGARFCVELPPANHIPAPAPASAVPRRLRA